ncbi:hypothetical protein N9K16_01470 [Alphaproteobacteria bacterium]|jgi:hypothetical protein|nr:hypothetical protein [Alphaproteobacteria bacterium]
MRKLLVALLVFDFTIMMTVSAMGDGQIMTALTITPSCRMTNEVNAGEEGTLAVGCTSGQGFQVLAATAPETVAVFKSLGLETSQAIPFHVTINGVPMNPGGGKVELSGGTGTGITNGFEFGYRADSGSVANRMKRNKIPGIVDFEVFID